MARLMGFVKRDSGNKRVFEHGARAALLVLENVVHVHEYAWCA